MPITSPPKQGISGSIQYLDTDGYTTGRSDFLFNSGSSTLIAPKISNNKIGITNSNITGLDFSEILTDDNATSKVYVDNFVSGIRWKQPVDLVSGYNITPWPPGGSNPVLNTIDSIALGGQERILVMHQNDKRQNGIYIVNNQTGWIRSDDLGEGSDAKSVAVFVSGGNTQKYFSFVCNTQNGNVGNNQGTTGEQLYWVKFSKGEFLKAGDGLTKTSEYFGVSVDNVSIEIDMNSVMVKNFGITTQKLADRSVTATKIASGSISSLQIQDGSIWGDKLLNLGISNSKLQNSTFNFISSSGLTAPGVISIGSEVNISLDSTVLRTFGDQNCSGIQRYTNQTNSFSPITGSVIVSGGVGIGGNMNTTGSVTAGGFSVNGTTMLSSGKLSGITTIENNTDAVNKLYVDNASLGIKWKNPCKLASVSHVIPKGVQIVDGVTSSSGNFILLKNQVDPKTNGIYIANNTDDWIAYLYGNVSNFATFVEEGTTNAYSSFVVSNSPAIIGTDNILFNLFSRSFDTTVGPQSGLTKIGTELFLSIDNSTIKINNDGKLYIGELGTQNLSSNCIVNNNILDGTIDQSKLYGNIGISKLEKNSIILNTGYGLLGGKTVELGSSIQLSIDNDVFMEKTLTNGNIFIGDSSNKPYPRTLTGDIHLDSSGLVTIENESVTNSKIAIGAVSNDKLLFSSIHFKGESGVTLSQETISLGNKLTIGLDSSVIRDTGGIMYGSLIIDSNENSALNISNGGIMVKKDITLGGDISIGGRIECTGAIKTGNGIQLEDPSLGSSFKTIIQSNNLISDWMFTLPVDGGNDSDVLITDGNGNTKWEKINSNWNYRTVSDDTYANYTDDIIGVMTSEKPITIYLPIISGKNKITIVDEGGNSDIGNVIIVANGIDTIVGNTSISISDKYNAYSLYCRNGSTNWFIC